MRVAVIGGGLCGCASVHYLVQSYAEERAKADRERGASEAAGAGAAPEVVLFEESGSVGGSKFCSVVAHDRHGAQVVAELGRVSVFDVVGAYARDALQSAGQSSYLQLARGLHGECIKSTASYDYSEMKFAHELSSPLLLRILHTLLSGASRGIADVFWRVICAVAAYKMAIDSVERDDHSVIAAEYYATAFAVVLAIVGLPHFFDYVARRYVLYAWVLSSQLQYSRSPHSVSRLAEKHHLEQAEHHRLRAECRSPMLAQFLSRTGFERDAVMSAQELLKYELALSEHYTRDVVLPAFSRCEARAVNQPQLMSGLRAKLSLLGCDPVPGRNYLGRPLEGGEKWCAALASHATVRLRHRVCAIRREMEKGFTVELVDNRDQPRIEAFDAVIIAAPLNLEQCALDLGANAIETRALLGYTESNINFDVSASEPCAAGFASLIRGELSCEYFLRAPEARIPDILVVKNSPHVSHVERLAEGLYVVLSRAPSLDGKARASWLSDVFSDVDEIVASRRRRAPKHHGLTPSDCCSAKLQTFVLAPKCVYAAAAHRLGSDVQLDLMAARNAASLLAPSFISPLSARSESVSPRST